MTEFSSHATSNAWVDWEKSSGYSHLSLRGIRGPGYRKLMEAAAGKFCFIHDEHLEKRQAEPEAASR